MIDTMRGTVPEVVCHCLLLHIQAGSVTVTAAYVAVHLHVAREDAPAATA